MNKQNYEWTKKEIQLFEEIRSNFEEYFPESFKDGLDRFHYEREQELPEEIEGLEITFQEWMLSLRPENEIKAIPDRYLVIDPLFGEYIELNFDDIKKKTEELYLDLSKLKVSKGLVAYNDTIIAITL